MWSRNRGLAISVPSRPGSTIIPWLGQPLCFSKRSNNNSESANRFSFLARAINGFQQYRFSEVDSWPALLNWPGHKRSWRGLDVSLSCARSAGGENFQECPGLTESMAVLGPHELGAHRAKEFLWATHAKMITEDTSLVFYGCERARARLRIWPRPTGIVGSIVAIVGKGHRREWATGGLVAACTVMQSWVTC